MDELKSGFEKFRSTVYPQKRDLFQKLAGGQSPHTLLITCSDSRIDPELILQAEPGDLFVIRNAGNIVPPYGSPVDGVQGTIEYAVSVLKVRYAVVCGHSSCGAVTGLLNRDSLKELPMVDQCLSYAEPVLDRIGDRTDLEAAVKANVLVQLEHLGGQPAVANAVDAGQLQLFGWYYDIGSGQVASCELGREDFANLA